MTVGLAGHRQLGIDDGRQRIVRHDDRVRGIASDIAIRRDDDGDRLAGEADDVGRNRAMLGRREWRPDRHRREELGDLRAGEHRLDAVHRLRGADVNRRDPPVRDVASLERDVLHAGDLHVVDIGAAALDQARVFAALDALANELRKHGCSRPWLTSLPRGVSESALTMC